MANAKVKMVRHTTIMRGKGFSVGFNEVKRNRPFDPDKYKNDSMAQWGYERGRQFAYIFSGSLKNDDNKLSYAARAAFRNACMNSTLC